MKTKLLILITTIASISLSFTWPKNQQPQMFGSPYYAELKGKLKIDENAKFGFISTRFSSNDGAFMKRQSSIGDLMLKIDSFFINKNISTINISSNGSSANYPDVYFGPMNETIDQPMYVQKQVQGYAPNQVVMAAYKGNKKVNKELIAVMQSQNLDYIFVPILRETLIYPSGILKEFGPFSSTSASSKKYYLDLGTNHVLTGEKFQSLNDPIGVFVLCVGLMNKEGKIVSVVTEGITTAKQSNFFEQVLDIRTGNSPAEISNAINLRRKDLPGNPFNWEEATKNAYLHLMQKNTFVPKVKYKMNVE